jgi:hypothetical protein
MINFMVGYKIILFAIGLLSGLPRIHGAKIMSKKKYSSLMTMKPSPGW